MSQPAPRWPCLFLEQHDRQLPGPQHQAPWARTRTLHDSPFLLGVTAPPGPWDGCRWPHMRLVSPVITKAPLLSGLRFLLNLVFLPRPKAPLTLPRAARGPGLSGKRPTLGVSDPHLQAAPEGDPRPWERGPLLPDVPWMMRGLVSLGGWVRVGGDSPPSGDPVPGGAMSPPEGQCLPSAGRFIQRAPP